MENSFDLLSVINRHYSVSADRVEFMRDAGSVSHAVFSGTDKYFLRVTKPALFGNASKALEVHLFLQKQDFPVPAVIFTKDCSPCVQVTLEDGEHLLILYEFIEGQESDPEEDAEAVGALIGRFHRMMKDYRGSLIERDRYYYVEKYLEQMRLKKYPRTEEFAAYGEALWERVRDLPRGVCHGDLYNGNIHKTPDGKLYLLDFDTACVGFPMYDPVLFSHTADFFELNDGDYVRCKKIFERFLPAYLNHSFLSAKEIAAFDDLTALYHFALEAAILDIFGLDCVDDAFLDRQLDWLYGWRKQSEENKSLLQMETKDLLLRTVDLPDIQEVERMWDFENGSISPGKALEAIEYMRNSHRQNRLGHIHHLCLAVFEKGGGNIIGWCGLDGTVPEKLDIFYSIDPRYRNKGYASQCAARLLAYGFDEAKIPYINGGCDQNNIASFKIMKKIGMEQNAFEENGDPLFFMDEALYRQKSSP